MKHQSVDRGEIRIYRISSNNLIDLSALENKVFRVGTRDREDENGRVRVPIR